MATAQTRAMEAMLEAVVDTLHPAMVRAMALVPLMLPQLLKKELMDLNTAPMVVPLKVIRYGLRHHCLSTTSGVVGCRFVTFARGSVGWIPFSRIRAVVFLRRISSDGIFVVGCIADSHIFGR